MAYIQNGRFCSATVVGILLILLGTFMALYWPSFFNTILTNKIAMKPHSTSFEHWKTPPIPLYIHFYFFNWTNSEDLKTPGSKPILNELGPYIFREKRKKMIKRWNENNYTVTFQQNRTWAFEASLSNGSLDDVITTINVPAITAAFAVRNASYFMQFMFNQAMKLGEAKIMVHKKVRELLFEGYSDPLLDVSKILPSSFVPVQIPFDKFGWFYPRNGSATYDGTFNMFTGVDNITKFGKIGAWKYENRTNKYYSHCGMLNGSAGELFPPNRDKTSISIFISDICRSLTLKYKEKVEVHGIPGYRYWADESTFIYRTSNPDNWCFCTSQDCAPNGVMDISSCKYGAPAFVSFPHFYQADPWYRESVVGMKPKKELHELFIDLEPQSGIPLQVSASLQINVLLQPMRQFTILDGVPKIYFPTIWLKQTARMDRQIALKLKVLTILPAAGVIFSFVILITGVLLILFLSLYTLKMKSRQDTYEIKSIFSKDAQNEYSSSRNLFRRNMHS